MSWKTGKRDVAAVSKVVTYEEYIGLPERPDAREEVVDGEIRPTPPAVVAHARTVFALACLLRDAIDGVEFEVFTTSFGIVISQFPLKIRNPDIAVYRRSEEIIRDGLLHSAPLLAVEVLSPSNTRREMGGKLNDFRELGIAEVWLVSPEAQTIEVLTLSEGGYVQAKLLSGGPLGPTRIPQATVDVHALWK